MKQAELGVQAIRRPQGVDSAARAIGVDWAGTPAHVGPDHPDTLSTRHNLAGWRRLAGGS
jgi:hypothetical protein